ncbi:MAG: RnfABCDGE type electron transport complex subunit D [Ruminococcus sp.]|nr:RnfABCDGE type electron transport complex subunit D [Ruminococcus sp.]
MLKKQKKERLIWIDVTITLLALEIMAYFYYGIRALAVGVLCIAVSLAAELISLRLRSRKFTADDLSCTSDALITALMMPASIELGIPAAACVFAVTAAKNVFGGRRNMIFSPAAAAYLFILTSWEKELLLYPKVYDKIGILDTASELVSSASYTFNTTGTMEAADFELLLGSFPGPMGAVSILLLLVAAVVLIFRKDISAGAFAGTMFGTIFMAYLCPAAENPLDSVKYVLAANMTLFAAIYIISDRRIAPGKNYYAFFYGLFIAITSYIVTLTTGKENVIVIMSVLFTPLSLMLKSLENKIERTRFAETTSVSDSVKQEGAENCG